MKAIRVGATDDELLDPASGVWHEAPEEDFELMATPLVLQPSEYVQTKWKTEEHGAIGSVRVAAAHNGRAIGFRLEWNDPTDDSHPDDMSDFPDQAAAMLPFKDIAPMEEMGTPEQPVNMWLWRGDREKPFYVTATGRGTTVRRREDVLAASAQWRDGRWSIVIARPFNVSLPADAIVPLAPGLTHRCTFAVWQGSGKERGGLKAYHPKWEPLEIER